MRPLTRRIGIALLALFVAAAGVLLALKAQRSRRERLAFGTPGPWAFVFDCMGHDVVDMGTGELTSFPLAKRDSRFVVPNVYAFREGGCWLNTLGFDGETNRLVTMVSIVRDGRRVRDTATLISMVLPDGHDFVAREFPLFEERGPQITVRPRHDEVWILNGGARPVPDGRKDYRLTLDVLDVRSLESRGHFVEDFNMEDNAMLRYEAKLDIGRLFSDGGYFDATGRVLFTGLDIVQVPDGPDSIVHVRKVNETTNPDLRRRLAGYLQTNPAGKQYLDSGIAYSVGGIDMKVVVCGRRNPVAVYTVDARTAEVGAVLADNIITSPYLDQLSPDANGVTVFGIERSEGYLGGRVFGTGIVRLYDRRSGAVRFELHDDLFKGELGGVLCMMPDGSRFLYASPRGGFLVDLPSKQIKKVSKGQSWHGVTCVMSGQNPRRTP